MSFKTRFLRKSTLSIEGPLTISKPIKIPLLLDEEEMRSLLNFLHEENQDLSFYNTSSLLKPDEGVLSMEEFISFYGDYVRLLQSGKSFCPRPFHGAFSSALSLTQEIFYEIAVEGGGRLIKPLLPPIQLQHHQIVYSKESGEIYSMAYAENSITFGIQLSYPLLYQNPHTHEVLDVDESSLFPNTALFKKMRIWVREHTVPTPFIIGEKKINHSMRLGKKCFSWINRHPQLLEQKLSIKKENSLYPSSRQYL